MTYKIPDSFFSTSINDAPVMTGGWIDVNSLYVGHPNNDSSKIIIAISGNQELYPSEHALLSRYEDSASQITVVVQKSGPKSLILYYPVENPVNFISNGTWVRFDLGSKRMHSGATALSIDRLYIVDDVVGVDKEKWGEFRAEIPFPANTRVGLTYKEVWGDHG